MEADLNSAVKAGDVQRVKALLDRGAGVNARNTVGAAPLHEAAWSGNSELIGLLLARGAHVNVRHAEAGSTPLERRDYQPRGYREDARTGLSTLSAAACLRCRGPSARS